MQKRCSWAEKNAIEIEYHDNQWGVPLYDDKKLFKMLILEAMQAGLSWLTILNKRENMRVAFDDFDAIKISMYDENKMLELLANPGIIRNRLKLKAMVTNANAYLKIKETSTFSDFLWDIVGGKPIINSWSEMSQLPAKTELSDKMSKILIKNDFKFVGSTICYALMQATGMVNDHMVWCKCYNKCCEISKV